MFIRSTIITLVLAAPVMSSAAILPVPDSFLTIQAGIDAAAEGDTVLVAPGTYFECLNLSDKTITLGSHYITTGDTMYMHETVIDANQQSGVIAIGSKNKRSAPTVSGFTIQNAGNKVDFHYGSGINCSYADPTFDHLVIRNNQGNSGGGGGCSVWYSNPVFESVFISGNRALTGGGIYFAYSNPILRNTMLINNTTGGDIYIQDSESAIFENVIVRREDGNVITCYNSTVKFYRTEMSHNTGELFICGSSNISFVNSIFYGNNSLGMVTAGSTVLFINSIVWFDNSSSQIQVGNSYDIPQNILIFDNSVLKNGVDGIVGIYREIVLNKDLFLTDNTISIDPLFIDPVNGNFRLRSNSQCIDAGTTHFEWNGETIINYSVDDYKGSAPDIGCYEYDQSINIKKDENTLPLVLLLTPYPNPFNSSVTIPYKICNYTHLTISIYNLAGQKVEQLSSDNYAPGYHSITWNATGYASGTYYCMVSNGNTRQIRKIQYLK